MRKLAIPVTAVLLATLAASPAAAVDKLNSKKLRDAVTVSGILGHERVLQRIANQNGGTRASGTPGYAASAAYVKATLKKAGYKVSEQKFTFPFFQELAPATLAQTSPTPTTYETGAFSFSGSGDVTGRGRTARRTDPAAPRRPAPRPAARPPTSSRPPARHRRSPSSSAAPARSRSRRRTPSPPATTPSSSSTRASPAATT